MTGLPYNFCSSKWSKIRFLSLSNSFDSDLVIKTVYELHRFWSNGNKYKNALVISLANVAF